MTQIEKLIQFETEYPRLYDVKVNGVPVYAALRDGVNARINGGEVQESSFESEQGKISLRRVIDSFFKLKRFKKAKSAVFASAVYRRDKGRNLAAEFLMDKYPDTVVFEWPSRNESFDFAYFTDKNRDKYCPLEWYLIKYKLYMRLHRKEYQHYCDECKALLADILPENTDDLPQNYRCAVEYLKSEMPSSYATTIISQKLFKKLFGKYKNLEHAVDFWGSARENIIPVLPGNPESVELQHGIITKVHPGYVYPDFVKSEDDRFFGRTLLVFGEKVKDILTEDSIFRKEQIEVVGNPRIIKYKKEFPIKADEKKYILFLSGAIGNTYYETMADYLSGFQKYMENDDYWKNFKIAVKLHPRENNEVIKKYRVAIPNAEFFDNTTQLYELISKSQLMLTMASTALYEAALFDVPTLTLKYYFDNIKEIYGFEPWTVSSETDIKKALSLFNNPGKYNEYLNYLKSQTKYYM